MSATPAAPAVASKSIFTSKTFWFNALTGVADAIGQFSGLIPVQYQPFIALASAIINVGLRYVSSQPVHVTAP